MNSIDIISNSPRTYIFQKSSNKTNLGGILTLIYFIFLPSIFVGYIYDYAVYEKYEYHDFYKFFLNEEQIKEKKKDPEYNPSIDFSFDIQNKKGKSLKENFMLVIGESEENINKFEEIKIGQIINKKADEFLIMILFKCKGENCSDSYTNFFEEQLTFIMYYKTKIIDFENADYPIQNKTFNYSIPFIVNNYILFFPVWEVYNYEEQKDIFSRLFDYMNGKRNNYTYGRIVASKYQDLSRTKYNKIEYDNETDLELEISLELRIINNLEGIHLYKRKALSLLDYFANIAALGTTILNLLSKIFELTYSENFDNYKIIDKILSKENKKAIELNNKGESNLNLEINLINKDFDEYEDNNLIIDENNSDNKNNVINDIEEYEDKEETDKKITKLPKLRFYDFLFNLVYSKCCAYIKNQKLIDSCNQILYRYFSVENILYNQILFENLMKDYKWNNPELKSIQINDSINNMKKFV